MKAKEAFRTPNATRNIKKINFLLRKAFGVRKSSFAFLNRQFCNFPLNKLILCIIEYFDADCSGCMRSHSKSVDAIGV